MKIRDRIEYVKVLSDILKSGMIRDTAMVKKTFDRMMAQVDLIEKEQAEQTPAMNKPWKTKVLT